MERLYRIVGMLFITAIYGTGLIAFLAEYGDADPTILVVAFSVLIVMGWVFSLLTVVLMRRKASTN